MHTDTVTGKALTVSATYTKYAPLFSQVFALPKFNSFPTLRVSLNKARIEWTLGCNKNVIKI